MPKAPSSKKTPAPSPYEDPKKKAAPEPTEPIWEKKPKNFSIGGDIQPRRELGRYVKWPAYVRIQRQRKILYQRLKVPPSINQFSNSLDKNLSVNLFKLLHKYKPEGKQEKKERIAAAAEAKAGGEGEEAKKKPLYVKYGLNHITKLCEDKKAQLVVIAHDVDPIELVIWLPAVCRKVDIPYCIVKSKSRLGSIVGKKTATAVALTSVRPEVRNAPDVAPGAAAAAAPAACSDAGNGRRGLRRAAAGRPPACARLCKCSARRQRQADAQAAARGSSAEPAAACGCLVLASDWPRTVLGLFSDEGQPIVDDGAYVRWRSGAMRRSEAMQRSGAMRRSGAVRAARHPLRTPSSPLSLSRSRALAVPLAPAGPP
jgi:large subunit ribosomal protein L7Ae